MQNQASDGRPPYLLESVDAALQIVLLVQQLGEVRLVDVANELGIARSTAHRLLRTLIWRDFLTQDRVGKAYRAGPVLVAIAAKTRNGDLLRRVARPHLEHLARITGETVNIFVREGSNARFVDGVEGNQILRVAARTGAVLPASVFAGGKVLIAWMAEEERRALYNGKLPRLTQQTTTDYEDLAVELAEVRRCGYAVNRDGSAVGLSAIGVPVRDPDNVIAGSVAIAMPSERFAAKPLSSLLAPLLAAASTIEDHL